MKKILLPLVLFASACGSQTPLRRGDTPQIEIKTLATNNTPDQPADQPAPPPEPPPEPTDVDKNYFEQAIFPFLDKKCNLCHDNPAKDFESAKAMIVFKNPEQSKLYIYATASGVQHRKVFAKDSAEAIAMVSWINGGRLH